MRLRRGVRQTPRAKACKRYGVVIAARTIEEFEKLDEHAEATSDDERRSERATCGLYIEYAQEIGGHVRASAAHLSHHGHTLQYR
eukprot:1632174-Prymnesium_polylepis.1